MKITIQEAIDDIGSQLIIIGDTMITLARAIRTNAEILQKLEARIEKLEEELPSND